MKVLLLVAALYWLGVSLSSATLVERFDNFKVFKVDVNDDAQLASLRELSQSIDVQFLNEVTIPGRSYYIAVDSELQDKLKDILSSVNLVFDVVSDDLQSIIDEIRGSIPKFPSTFNWTEYHDYDVLYRWLDLQALKHFRYVKSYIIGYSYEGRPIKALKISKKKGNKAILIESNIHAIEWISSAASTYLLNELLNSKDEEMQKLSWDYDWVFVPMLNPDGHEFSRKVQPLWRKNRRPTGVSNSSGICYGIDMNRNFDFHWGKAGYNFEVACDHWYGGTEPDSEPEVRAYERFVQSFAQQYFCISISFHSYGQYLLLPYGHTNTEFPPNYEQMLRISDAFAVAAAQLYGTKYTYGASGLLNYPVSGSTKDWAYGIAGIPYTATLELRDRGTYGFFLPAEQIIPTSLEVIEGLKALIAQAEKEELCVQL